MFRRADRGRVMGAISLKGLTKSYGVNTVVQAVSLDIADGEFVVLVGPSGCGKSTTLRMIAGLEEITAGTVSIGGAVVNEREPKDRDIAMVFQNYAIYPHRTVAENIGFGLYTSKAPAAEKRRRIEETAEILGLTPYLGRKPAALSGGQRQRVAIGRAMVRDPAVFLFDEPLSNLDAQLRAQMRLEIKKLHQRLGATIIFVTHDQVEAMTLADRIVVMRDGHILQVGVPEELYDTPADIFTARFIGTPSMNLLAGRFDAGPRSIRLDAGGAAVTAPALSPPPADGCVVMLGVRPHDLVIGAPVSGAGLEIEARVSLLEPLGPETLVHLDLAGTPLIARAEGRARPAIGSMARAGAATDALHVFDAASERVFGRRALSSPRS